MDLKIECKERENGQHKIGGFFINFQKAALSE